MLNSAAFGMQPFNFDDAFPENSKPPAPKGHLPFGASPAVKHEKEQRVQMAEKKRELLTQIQVLAPDAKAKPSEKKPQQPEVD